MLKMNARPSFAHQVITHLLLLALLGQTLAPLGQAAGERPGVRSLAGGRVGGAEAGSKVAPSETGPSTNGSPSADGTPGVAQQGGSCPAAGSRPAAARLTYTGRVEAHCGEPLPVSALLTDECGNPLTGRQVNFTAGGVTASASTDANGVASTSLVPRAATLPLSVNFGGDDDHAPAQDSAAVRVTRVATSVRYVGGTVLSAGVSESVSAVLTEALSGSPVPAAELIFEVGSVRTSATTDANGVATASVQLPNNETFERAPLRVTFAGDDCRGPASAAADVTAYLRTAFVIWGGNSERLRIGQRVNFWGHSWAKQVSQGDYKAHNDFKGYADTVRQFQLCQVNARTTSTPQLNDSCWSTKPGQSFPPATLPQHIGVIVTTSADKKGAPDFGNIAALVVLKVAPEPRYGAVPGKSGFGTIVAVIADGEGLFPQPPSLTASQAQPAAALPAQTLNVAVTLNNNSTSPAANVSVKESFVGVAPPEAAAQVGALPARETRTRAFGVTVPALPARREDESSQDYQRRLGAADGTVYASHGVVSFQDATGRALPPLNVSSFSRLQIPRLTVGISGPPCVSPGTSLPYVVRLKNMGGAVAVNATAVVTLPDGTTTRVEATNLEPGREFTSTVSWTVPPIAAKGASESDADYLARLTSFDGKSLKVSASVTWRDALGNAYGAVEQECAGVLRVPVLSQTASSPPPMLPGQKVALTSAVRNAGSGNAPQARLRVNNPDASVFDATPFGLPAGGSLNVAATLTAPSVPAKEQEETDDAYRARLQSADNKPLDFSLALEWTDAAGNTYGPVAGPLRTTGALPILLLTLGARETVESGEAITYRVTAENVGHAEAAGHDLSLTLPGGKVQPITLPSAALPPGQKQSAVVEFVVPAEAPEGQLNAQASAAWRDAAANGYGRVSAGSVTNVINPNRPPIVNAGPYQAVVLPAAVQLPGTASDDGKPAGSTLTVLWTKVSGPGSVSFTNPNQAATAAAFGAEGTYVLRLTASDSALSASDEATVVVATPPTGPTYGVTADFTQGEGVNVIRDEFNHLHVKNETTPFNFIWVAVSSRGTVVKLDTDTGKVLGEFFTSPAGQPRNPSRTTVDHNGNVWASNRDGNSVLRIGLAENGQCVDRNGNGVIETSKGQNDIRPWTNAGGVDTDGGVETAQDECIINYTRVRAHGTRHVSVNAANDVWVSGTGGHQFDLLDGVTGQIKRQEPSVGYGGYGGLIDKKGVIWSARALLRWDTALPLKGTNGGNWKGYGHDSYGLCIDSQGNVWNTELGGNRIHKFAPDGTLVGSYAHGNHYAQGCVVDGKDHVWVAHSLYANTVGHLKPDGTLLGSIPVGSGPTGVAVDANGKIWATNHNSRTVSRIDPEMGPMGADGGTRVGQVDLTTVDLKGNLYNYSDMTGSTLSGAPAGGTWTQVFDSGIEGAEWGTIAWNGSVCGDASLLVGVSSSGDGVNFSAPVPATNGDVFNVPRGRHLKVSVTFKRAGSGESPFLYDLTVGTKGFKLPAAAELPPTVDAGPDQTATMPNPANLVGNACDAGRVSGLAVSWEKVSGPGQVSFANARVPATSATFSEAGEYTLRLTAADSAAGPSDETTVLVLPFNDPPAVNAGADQSHIIPAALPLNGSIKDDGLPLNSSVTVSWSKLSGPGEVSFADAAAAATAATFSEPGDYVLRLTGYDSQLANVDDLSVKVYPPNDPPAVNAGGDLTIRLPEKASLDATVTDDGLPLGKTVTVAWSKVSGPGTVTFAKASAAETVASFNQPGTYVLRLTAGDTQLSAGDELTVVVKPANQPPSVGAGANQTVTLPDAASLAGAVDDDGLPEGRAVTVTWTKVSGPGLVTFAAPGDPATTVTFSEPGAYVLRLTASDSALTRSDDVAVTVNPSPFNLPPTVSAGPDQTITLPAKAGIAGLAGDDRQPAGSALGVSWSKVSGPGSVTFDNAAAAATAASFSAAGEYVLRLMASDTALTAADEIKVTVLPVNLPPTVKAGADQLVSFPAAANLSGTATDDGMPAGGSLTVAWTKVSGPGEVTFADPSALATAATFGTGGQYVLRLTASDSALSRADDVAVTVNEAPTVEAGAAQSVHLPDSASLAGVVRDDALPQGKAIVVAWTKASGPGTVTFGKPSSAATSATFGEVGTYVLRLSAGDSLLEAADEVTVTVLPPLPPPPSVALNSPADGAEVTTRVEVTGSASGGAWKLEYSLGGASAQDGRAWTTFASGSAPVSNSVLGTFDPTLLLNGTYAIRLTAADDGGRSASAGRSLVVAGQQKVGNFTLSFEDLVVPVPGVPIQLIRTYDSRDKRVGDFGVGWTLGFKNVRLEKSVELGAHWRQIVMGGVLPQYCLQPTRPNIVTITFPDDRVYKFQATTARQCQTIVPIETARFGFTPMPGTRGTLVPEDSVEVLVDAYSGPVELLDFDDPQLRTYDPTVFRFTDENGIAYVIDQRSGVRSVSDRNGNRLTFTSDGIIHSGGKGVRFIRDGQGRITQIVDPQGGARSYAYDANGDLAVFTDAEGRQTRFTYNNTHGLLSLLDARGTQPVRNEYDDAGRLVSHTDAYGKKITYANDLNGRQQVITDRLGNVTLHEYDARGNVIRSTGPTGATTTATFDARDNRLSETNALGHTTRYTYDTAGNRLSETDPLGGVTRYTYDAHNQLLTTTDPRGNVTSQVYDARGNPTAVKDALGAVTTFTYSASGLRTSETDALGNVTRYEYDGSGELLRRTDPLGNETSYTYDLNGNRLSEAVRRGPRTLVTRTEYDKLGRPVKTTHPDGSTTLIEYNEIGQRSAVTDQAGRRTTFEYDLMGRLSRTTYPDGTTDSATYDAQGRRLTRTDAAGRVTTFAHDAEGRLTKLTHPDGTSAGRAYDPLGRPISSADALGNVTSYEYDAANRRTKVIDALGNVTAFAYDANGNQLSLRDARGNVTTFEHDALGRRTKVIHADRTSDAVGYNALGLEVSKADQAGRIVRYEYDGAGRLTKAIDALNQEIRYAHDELGYLVSQTDALGRTTRFEYDEMGRRTRRVTPLNTSESYAYDAGGNLTSKTDHNGKTTAYRYDAMNRLLSKSPDAAAGEPAVTFTYMPTGKRASMSDATGTTTYTYDARDRLTGKATPQGTLRYAYDAAGNLLSTRSSNVNGVSVTYSYDALNRNRTVTDSAAGGRPATGTTTYSYDAAGNLAGHVYANGVKASYAYNSLNRLTDISVAGTDKAIAGYAYTLGPAGNRLGVTEASGRKASYSYDALYRLTNETITDEPTPGAVGGSVGYSYDAAGNRLERTSTVSAIPSTRSAYDANDQLLGDTYDANGNTRVSGGNTYDYDSENRLTGQNNGAVKIVYDGDGNRVSKTAGGVTTEYLVDTNNLTGHAQVAEEMVGGAVRRVYTYGQHLISQNQLVGGRWSASFYTHDGSGSVRLLTDAGGAVTDTYDYDAFGVLLSRTGTTPNEYLYTGERYDPNLGFYYLRARYMNPETGRFVSADGYVGSDYDPLLLHKYLYANADPVNRIDPTGNESLKTMMVSLSVRMVIFTIQHPILTTTVGFIAGLFIPEEVSMQLMSTPFAPVGAVGLAEARGIRLLKNSRLVRWLGAQAQALKGQMGDAFGLAFKKWAQRYLFPGASEFADLADDKISSMPDLEWRGWIIEVTTSARNLSARKYRQITNLAASAGDKLIVLFLEKPSPHTLENVKRITGKEAYYIFE
jgi:RHS repeat-associated protein